VARTGHLIVYATTVLKYVGDRRYLPEVRLRQVVAHDSSSSTSAFNSVDILYHQILEAAARDNLGNIDNNLCSKLRNLVGALCVAKRPLTVASLASLLDISILEAQLDIGALSSVLLCSEDSNGSPGARIVRIFHQSFEDYVSSRCNDTRFLVNRTAHQAAVAIHCLKVLNDTLREDICGIQDYRTANADICDPDLVMRLQLSVPDMVNYACVFWPAHAQSGGTPTPALIEQFRIFSQSHLLHWIELLSLLDQLPHAILSLPHLILWCQGFTQSDTPHALRPNLNSNNEFLKVAGLLQDTLRALQTYDPVLKTHALQTYQSLYTTMPECGLFHVSDRKLGPRPLISSRPAGWSSVQLVMRGHNGAVSCIAFSCDGTRIVTSSYDNTVRVWDAQSGREIASLEGHSNMVTSVAFSPDGTKIASGSYD
jgi:hypothetical protein